jgi:hypothetical protein
MAARENQGLQIALIIFVMVTVVLCVATFLYHRSAADAKIALKDLETNLNAEKMAVSNYQKEVEELKKMLGFAFEDKLDPTIKGAFDQDMHMFADSFPAERRNYRSLPGFLMDELRKRNSQLADARAALNNEIVAKDAARREESGMKQQALTAQTTMAAELSQERAKFNDERGRIASEKTTVANELASARKEITELAAKSTKDVQDLTNALQKSKQLADAQEAKIKGLSTETFESPDGKITWVNQREGIVWINIGRDDGLRRQISFSVYAIHANNVVKDKKKGSIEVTQILDGHLAEARIVDDALSDPILPGDLIYSPAWQPGSRVRFAIAGFIDFDGNKTPDDEQLHSLIALNGGVVDAFVNKQGIVEGKLSLDTRFLVLGERPKDESSKAVEGFTQLIGDAQRLGIEQISVDRLLDYMGYKGREKIDSYNQRGVGALESRAAPAKTSGAAALGTEDRFRPRTP